MCIYWYTVVHPPEYKCVVSWYASLSLSLWLFLSCSSRCSFQFPASICHLSLRPVVDSSQPLSLHGPPLGCSERTRYLHRAEASMGVAPCCLSCRVPCYLTTLPDNSWCGVDGWYSSCAHIPGRSARPSRPSGHSGEKSHQSRGALCQALPSVCLAAPCTWRCRSLGHSHGLRAVLEQVTSTYHKFPQRMF